MQTSGAQEIRNIKLTDLMNEVGKARAAKKYLIAFDQSGSAEVFFNYKGTMREVYKFSIGMTLGSTTKEQAID